MDCPTITEAPARTSDAELVLDQFSDSDLLRQAEQIEAKGWHPNHSQNLLARALRELHGLRQAQAAQHHDDLSVNAFASVMKAKLEKKRAGLGDGWRGADCTAERLSRMLREHVEKGDPVDVANFAMMLHQRSERITPPVRQPGGENEREELLAYLLQDDLHNRLTPRLLDIGYTAWNLGRCGKNKEDGGPCDWFNDTRPTVVAMVEQIRRDLEAAGGTR